MSALIVDLKLYCEFTSKGSLDRRSVMPSTRRASVADSGTGLNSERGGEEVRGGEMR